MCYANPSKKYLVFESLKIEDYKKNTIKYFLNIFRLFFFLQVTSQARTPDDTLDKLKIKTAMVSFMESISSS